MASGTLGQATLLAATNATVYTVPATATATVVVSILNRNSTTPVLIDLAVAASGTPSAAEYVFQSLLLEPSASVEKTGLLLSQNKQIVARSTAANVSVNVYGYEVI
jgi:hypothetical protein